MNTMYTKIVIIIIGFMMVVIGYWYGHISDNDKLTPSIGSGIKVGNILTPFTLTKLDGSPVTISPVGKIIVINFWGTGCPLSEDELLKLEMIAKNYQQKMDFYAINLQEFRGGKPDFISDNKIFITVLMDKDGAVYGKFEVDSTPTTMIINKYGMIKYRKLGTMTGDELEGIINSL